MTKHFIFLDKLDSTLGRLVTVNKQEILVRARELPLDLIADKVTDGETNLILSDHLVSSYELELNAKNQSQLNKIARYAVENKFPGRLEDYHIVTQKKSSKTVSVRAILHERFKEINSYFTSNNISLNNVSTESDLLKNNSNSLIFDDHAVTLCGNQLEQTYEFDKAIAALLSEKIFSALENTDDLQIIYSEDDSILVESICNVAPENIRLKKIIKDDRYYEGLALSNSGAINLLHGEYKTTKAELEYNSFWKFPIYLGASSLLVLTGGLFAQNYVLSGQVDKFEDVLTTRYVEIFPNASKPRDAVDLSNKLKSKLKQVDTQPQSDLPIDALSLLSLSSQAANNKGVNLKALNIDKNAAEILVSGPSIEILNAFKDEIEKLSNNRTITMDSVNSVDDKYQGKINIK